MSYTGIDGRTASTIIEKNKSNFFITVFFLSCVRSKTDIKWFGNIPFLVSVFCNMIKIGSSASELEIQFWKQFLS